MARAVLTAGLVRPIWQVGRYRVEGPDEDLFTLGTAALGALGRTVRAEGRRSLSRVHLVGSFPAEGDWGFAEALGLPRLEVRRHPAGAGGLWGALAAAAHDDGAPGREAVVAAEAANVVSTPGSAAGVRWGAGAVSFVLGNEPGLSVLRHGFRGHPPGHGPSTRSLIGGWLDALELPAGGARGEILFASEDEPTRWLSAWEETAPGISVTLATSDAPGIGPAMTLRAAFLLWELVGRLRTGETGAVVEVGRGRTGFAGFRLDGPVRWSGNWGDPQLGLPPVGEHFLDRTVAAGGVSQGAYVPHPRYLENLPSRWRLEGSRCVACAALTFPRRGYCRSCGTSEGLRTEQLPKTGLPVEAITTIGRGAQPTEFDGQVESGGSYDVAIVRLLPGVRATLQLTDVAPGIVRVGDRLSTALRRLYSIDGEWRYGLKGIPERLPTAESASRPSRVSARVRTRRRPPARRPSLRRVRRAAA